MQVFFCFNTDKNFYENNKYLQILSFLYKLRIIMLSFADGQSVRSNFNGTGL